MHRTRFQSWYPGLFNAANSDQAMERTAAWPRRFWWFPTVGAALQCEETLKRKQAPKSLNRTSPSCIPRGTAEAVWPPYCPADRTHSFIGDAVNIGGTEQDVIRLLLCVALSANAVRIIHPVRNVLKPVYGQGSGRVSATAPLWTGGGRRNSSMSGPRRFAASSTVISKQAKPVSLPIECAQQDRKVNVPARAAA